MKMQLNYAEQSQRSSLNHAHVFGALIAEEGYSKSTVVKYTANAEALCAALMSGKLTPADLTDDRMDRLAQPIINAASAKDKKHCLYRLNRFRDYFIETAGAPPRFEPPTDMSPRACLKREHKSYLQVQRGLPDITIDPCVRFFNRFVTTKFGDKLGDLNSIKPCDITWFLLELRERQNAPRDKTGPSHLRNLFQFLFWSGKTKRNLSNTLPKRRQPKPTGIPRYLEPEEVNRLIEMFYYHKKIGKRNYPMLLLVARLGPRAPEVTAIDLSDINWRAGEILIRVKRQLHDQMPLPVEVGERLVDYIQNERRGPNRVLFVSVKPPFKRFKKAQILSCILRDAYDATGISPPQTYIGSHILRHSLTNDMLRKGASLAEIGDVLRRRSPMTTTVYAQHNVDALRQIMRC